MKSQHLIFEVTTPYNVMSEISWVKSENRWHAKLPYPIAYSSLRQPVLVVTSLIALVHASSLSGLLSFNLPLQRKQQYKSETTAIKTRYSSSSLLIAASATYCDDGGSMCMQVKESSTPEKQIHKGVLAGTNAKEDWHDFGG